jgi:hypothetical protein
VLSPGGNGKPAASAPAHAPSPAQIGEGPQ